MVSDPERFVRYLLGTRKPGKIGKTVNQEQLQLSTNIAHCMSIWHVLFPGSALTQVCCGTFMAASHDG